MFVLQGCQGAPVIMSTPHFLDGDPTLVSAIDGINPDPELHQTYLHLEPLSGRFIVTKLNFNFESFPRYANAGPQKNSDKYTSSPI